MLLTLENPNDPLVLQRQQYLDEIARIEKIADDSVRWHAIRNLMFAISPHLREEDLIHQQTVKDRRDSTESRLWATNAERNEGRSVAGKHSFSSNMRQLYSMPEFLYRALQMIDPSFRAQQSSSDKKEVKKYNQKIWKAFPEYRLCKTLNARTKT